MEEIDEIPNTVNQYQVYSALKSQWSQSSVLTGFLNAIFNPNETIISDIRKYTIDLSKISY
jgi:hypothetical protein